MTRKKAIWIGASLLLVVAAVAVANFVVNRIVRERFDRELAHMQNRLDVKYEGLRFEFWSGKVRVGQVTATTANGQVKLLAESVQVRDWERDAASGVVSRMGISGKGVQIYRRGEQGGWVPQLKGYGYDDPKLGLELDYQYEAESRGLTLDRLNVGGKEMGAFSLQGKFADVAAVDWTRLGEGAMMQRLLALGSLKIASMKFEYNDFGLLPKIFAAHAAATNKTAPEYAEQIFGMVEGQKSLRLTPSMLEAIHQFLQKPDRIELVMQPAKPVGTRDWFTALLFRADLIKLLGVDIRT